MRSFEMTGIAGLFLQYSGPLLDTVTSIDGDVLTPPTRQYLRFTAGITGLVVGVTLTGETSAAVVRVEGVIITAGTLAGSDAAGIIFVTVVSGTPVTDENLRVATTTYCISRTAVLTIPQSGASLEAKSIVVLCETNPVRILFDGSDPTDAGATGDVSFGILLNPLDSYSIKGWTNVRNLKMINANTASNGVINLVVSYGGAE